MKKTNLINLIDKYIFAKGRVESCVSLLNETVQMLEETKKECEDESLKKGFESDLDYLEDSIQPLQVVNICFDKDIHKVLEKIKKGEVK